MSVQFVTSFNDKLYKASGHKLIHSFDRVQKGELFCYHECNNKIPHTEHTWSYSIKGHPMLDVFLSRNKDIIPTELGGNYVGCACNTRESVENYRHKRPGRRTFTSSWQHHVKGCPYHWFNKSVYRWFRKIVALVDHTAEARGYGKARYLIWIDCDVVFKQRMPDTLIENLFQGKDVFYIQGSRAWPETGIFGMDIQQRGLTLLDILRARYMTGEFREYERWDDCWQIMTTLEEHKDQISSRDILEKGHGHVFRKSVLKSYLDHDKGGHGKRKIVWGW